jgi:hypothetical protein
MGGHLGFWREKSWRTDAKLRIFDYQTLSLCCVAAHEYVADALKIYAQGTRASRNIDQDVKSRCQKLPSV